MGWPPLQVAALASVALLAAFYPIAKGSKLGAKDIVAVATFASAAIATNYSLAWLPNVKLMDALVFSTAFLFGLKVGAWTGAMIWAVYGSLNPYGFEPMTWLTTMAAESVYAALGAWARRGWGIGRGDGPYRPFAIAGLGATLLYDAITNLASGVIFSIYSGSLDWIRVSAIFLAGAPFSAVHVASNALIFPALGAPLVRKLSRIVGGEVGGDAQ